MKAIGFNFFNFFNFSKFFNFPNTLTIKHLRKGRLLRCKRRPSALLKHAFYGAKGMLRRGVTRHS